MNKRVLIISPYFPPSNAPDMQRVRQSLIYFNQYGWEPEVVAVNPKHSDAFKDELLNKSISQELGNHFENIKIHFVEAFDKKWTNRIGLGSIALRSLWYYRKKVDALIQKSHFDLIYFSTTQFPVCILGAYWKKQFAIPYVIDMQDPWHSEYYQNKPKIQRPKKYWFSYRLNKFLEPIAMRSVGGLIAVSEDYITELKKRYNHLEKVPSKVITFGGFEPDLVIARTYQKLFPRLLDSSSTNLIYIGRGGVDMHSAIGAVFKTLKDGFDANKELFSNLRMYFIGTSYAPKGEGEETIMPLAKKFGIERNVIEIADRISYYHTLLTLDQADGLFIPGSDDPSYTASKIFPYLLTKKPILAVLNSSSSAVGILKEFGVESVFSYDKTNDIHLKISDFLVHLYYKTLPATIYKPKTVVKYSAETMTAKQCELFNEVLKNTLDSPKQL